MNLFGLPLEILIAGAGAASSLFKSIKFVQEGEQGIKLRFGRALKDRDGKPRVIHPGFAFLIPFVETLQRHHVRQQTHRLLDQKVMISRGLVFNVSAVIMFRVTDIYRALFEISNLDSALVDLAMGILRDVLASKEVGQLSHISDISKELFERLSPKAEEWGVKLIQFNLTDCAPTPEAANLVSMQEGVRLKVEAVKASAKEMGVEETGLSPVFAAALIGVPLVTSVTNVEEKHLFDHRNGAVRQTKTPGLLARATGFTPNE